MGTARKSPPAEVIAEHWRAGLSYEEVGALYGISKHTVMGAMVKDGVHVRGTRPFEPRFWAKVDKNGPVPDYRPDLGPCWLWTGNTARGYGTFRIGGRNSSLPAHRVAYELAVGPIPAGKHIDHLCRVTLCVNPAHLEPVTQGENNQRSWDARQRITHCPRGHALDADNLSVAKNGHRRCRTCMRTDSAERRARARAARPPKPPLTHCPHGHEYTPENIYRTPAGRLRCRACNRERARQGTAGVA